MKTFVETLGKNAPLRARWTQCFEARFTFALPCRAIPMVNSCKSSHGSDGDTALQDCMLTIMGDDTLDAWQLALTKKGAR